MSKPTTQDPTTEIPEADVLRVTLPEWLTPEQAEDIRTNTRLFMDDLVLAARATHEGPRDACPPWCTKEDDIVDRGGKTHPNDHSVMHFSKIVDTWVSEEGSEDAPIEVQVDGCTYDHDPKGDWTQISAVNVSGTTVNLYPVDARRLAEALVAACDLIEQA